MRTVKVRILPPQPNFPLESLRNWARLILIPILIGKLPKFPFDTASLKDGRIRGSQDTASVPVYFPDCHVFHAFFLNSSNSGAGFPDSDFLALAIIGAEL
jgi:hypothetical protein